MNISHLCLQFIKLKCFAEVLLKVIFTTIYKMVTNRIHLISSPPLPFSNETERSVEDSVTITVFNRLLKPGNIENVSPIAIKLEIRMPANFRMG